MFNLSDFTVNLSAYRLDAAQVSILDKGLTFIPSTRHIPYNRILECKRRNIRSIKLHDFFQGDTHEYNPKLFKNLFIPKSTWVPPENRLSIDARKIISDITEYTASLVKKNRLPSTNPKTGPLIRLPNWRPNITRLETDAITKLKANQNIVIKSADKGGAVVVMDRHLYELEGLRQLTNTHYYTEIERPLATETVTLIQNTLNDIYRSGYLSEKQLRYLSPEVPVKPRPFYLLPKVHKPRNKWPHPNMPEGRPIVADCGSETERICKYIDHYLQPLAINHPSYIKDTYDFISKIRGRTVPSSCFLVTGDVTGLYTNMNIDLTLNLVPEILKKYPDPARPDKQLLTLLELTLKRNDFEFAGRIFLQICGTAMGKDYAPSLANIFLIHFDNLARTGFRISPELYLRFLDDIHFIWTGTRIELQEYEEYLNTLMPGIKISLTIRDAVIEFLDTVIYKVPISPGLCTLRTRVYFKPTDTHQLLHGNSFHPRHTPRGILKSQLIRFKRISSTKIDFDDACTTLYNTLKNRGYSSSLYRRTKKLVWETNYNTQTTIKHVNKPTEDARSREIWPLINFYDPISVKLANYTRRLVGTLKCAENTKLINCYRIHDNLTKKLVRSRFR